MMVKHCILFVIGIGLVLYGAFSETMWIAALGAFFMGSFYGAADMRKKNEVEIELELDTEHDIYDKPDSCPECGVALEEMDGGVLVCAAHGIIWMPKENKSEICIMQGCERNAVLVTGDNGQEYSENLCQYCWVIHQVEVWDEHPDWNSAHSKARPFSINGVRIDYGALYEEAKKLAKDK